MVLKKGDEFLELATGVVYRIYHISKHQEYLLISSRKGGEGEFVLNTNPKRLQEVISLIGIVWIPNTPAGRTLYGSKV
jgi:hypothetical protein